MIGGDIQMTTRIIKMIEEFKMTDMGDVSLVLETQITPDREKKTLTISQEEYTKSICKP